MVIMSFYVDAVSKALWVKNGLWLFEEACCNRSILKVI